MTTILQENLGRMEEYRLLDFKDEARNKKQLNFDCITPHILIAGVNRADLISFETRIINNLILSCESKVNLYLVDEESLFPNIENTRSISITRISENEMCRMMESDFEYYRKRYEQLINYNEKNFSTYNAHHPEEKMSMEIFLIPEVSRKYNSLCFLKHSGKLNQIGVHIIAGTNLLTAGVLNGMIEFQTRFLLYPCGVNHEELFFNEDIDNLPSLNELWDIFIEDSRELKEDEVWFQLGINGKVQRIKLL